MQSLKNFLHPFFRFIEVMENVLCTAGLFLTTFMAFFQVLNRYWFRFQIIWLNDVSLFIFIFTMFFAIPLTTREGEHTGVDVFVKTFFSGSPVRTLGFNAFLKLISIVTVGVFMIPSWAFALRAAKYPQYATLVRWFNTSWLMQSLFVCMALSLLHLVYGLICDTAEIRRLRRSGERG